MLRRVELRVSLLIRAACLRCLCHSVPPVAAPKVKLLPFNGFLLPAACGQECSDDLGPPCLDAAALTCTPFRASAVLKSLLCSSSKKCRLCG